MGELSRSIIPPETEHTHTIIFLHGRGDTGREIAETLFWSKDSSRRSLKEIFPTVRWVFPQAEPLWCERTRQEWSQWFDIWNTLDFTDREEMQAPGLRESVMSLRNLIYKEAQTVGGLDKVVLSGISQGGATAVHTILNFPVPDCLLKGSSKSLRLAAFVGFCCRLPFPGGNLEETREVLALEGSPNDDILRNTPVFLGHCVNDPLVFVEYGRQLRNALDEFGMRGIWKEYSVGGHWVNAPQGIDDMVEFLKAQGLPVLAAQSPSP